MSGILTLGAALLFVAPLSAQNAYENDFASPALSDWVLTSQRDFNEQTVEVSNDGRLRVRADTVGTRDDTVKFLGARLRRGFEVESGLCVRVTLDWNEQVNGSYLTAALVVAGGETVSNPLDLSDWLAVEYVGVPPGRNARMQIRAKSRGRERILTAEGWPEKQRSGRAIDTVRVELQVSPSRIRMWENGKLLYDAEPDETALSTAFVYLQLASHSNYRAREVYFDDVAVTPGACASAERR